MRKIRWVITPKTTIFACLLASSLNMCNMVDGVLDIDTNVLSITASAKELSKVKLNKNYLGLRDYTEDAIITLESLQENGRLGISSSELTPVTTSLVNIDTIGSVNMRNSEGVTITTNEVDVCVSDLLQAYDKEYDLPEWDTREKIATLTVIWNFLVEQQGVAPENAAGILGNIYSEGTFSQQQGTNVSISNISQARALLGSGKTGYGCAQWTYSKRQKALLQYYELAYELFPDNWDAVKIVAECCMILEECKAYNVFEDIYTATTIEDATGRVAVLYENYSGCESQWSRSNGRYHLTKSNSNGSLRLYYANSIYDYFTE